MTYLTGNLILASDINGLHNTVRAQLGVGTGAYGLGQSTASLVDATAGTFITAAKWNTLVANTNSILTHEGLTNITPTTVTTANLIAASSSIQNGVNNAYNYSGTTGLTKSDSAATPSTVSVAWGASGTRACVFNHTVTFASGDHARYFFNAGGTIKISCAKSGGSSASNASWAALASALGTIEIGYKNTTKIGGSGSCTLLNANNGGYWSGTGSLVQHALQYATTSGYTSDFIQVAYYWSGTPSNGGYPVLNIRTYWYNGSAGDGVRNIDGTTTTNLVVSSPATSSITNTWGTPTVGTLTPVASDGTRYFVFNRTISSATQNYVLYTDAVAYGWTQDCRIYADITVNNYVGATSTGNYAFYVHAATFPAGTTIILRNNHYIMGCGGDGGAGGVAGSAGGHAIYAGMAMTIYNYGGIYGGGGGGGGAIYSPYGEGGGGGAGYNGGAGGGGGGYSAVPGAAGTTWAGGAGGNLMPYSQGGTGGAIGAVGAAAYTYNANYPPYACAGGAAGYFAIGYGNISWGAVGTLVGNHD